MSTYSLTHDDVRVLAFARGWSPDREGDTQLELLRLRVIEVGVELIVVGERGVWVFGTDGHISHVDRLAGTVPLSATMLQKKGGDAVFLIDDGTVTRVAYDGTLVDAVTGSAELLAMRRMTIASAQNTTMPHGMFAPVFETSTTEVTMEIVR